MSQTPPRDPFLSQEFTSQSQLQIQPSTPYSQRAHSQLGRPILSPQDPGEMYTQRDYRAVYAQQEQDAAAAAAAQQAAAAAQQVEDDARQAAYDAEQAEYAEYLATHPPSPLPDFSRPLTPPPGFRPFTAAEEAIVRRVESANRPVQREDVFYGNQDHAAAADAQHKKDKEVARQFVVDTNRERRVAEAAAAAKKQGKGGVARKGGKRKTSKKSKSKSKYTRKSNKHRMQKKKSHRRHHI